MATFRSTTFAGYISQDQKETHLQMFHFPGTNKNRVFGLGRGVGIIRFEGFEPSESTWNTLRGLFTDQTAGNLVYKANRGASATVHRLNNVVAKLVDAKPLGNGWRYAVEFYAADQVPVVDSGGAAAYT